MSLVSEVKAAAIGGAIMGKSYDDIAAGVRYVILAYIIEYGSLVVILGSYSYFDVKQMASADAYTGAWLCSMIFWTWMLAGQFIFARTSLTILMYTFTAETTSAFRMLMVEKCSWILSIPLWTLVVCSGIYLQELHWVFALVIPPILGVIVIVISVIIPMAVLWITGDYGTDANKAEWKKSKAKMKKARYLDPKHRAPASTGTKVVAWFFGIIIGLGILARVIDVIIL